MGVGPVGFGLEHPFCNDCSGCNSFIVKSQDGKHVLEYISMEFAKDREFDGIDSQSIVLNYLDKVRPDLVVINPALHDLYYSSKDPLPQSRTIPFIHSNYSHNFNLSFFEKNLDMLVKRLKAVSKNVVIISPPFTAKNVINNGLTEMHEIFRKYKNVLFSHLIIEHVASDITSSVIKKFMPDGVHPNNYYFSAVLGMIVSSVDDLG